MILRSKVPVLLPSGSKYVILYSPENPFDVSPMAIPFPIFFLSNREEYQIASISFSFFIVKLRV
jgi:hypothetical protein